MKIPPSGPSSVPARRQRPVLVAAVVCGVIVAGVPVFFLFYSVLGSALLGALILGTLIAMQYFLLLPAWRSLGRRKDRCIADVKNGNGRSGPT